MLGSGFLERLRSARTPGRLAVLLILIAGLTWWFATREAAPTEIAAPQATHIDRPPTPTHAGAGSSPAIPHSTSDSATTLEVSVLALEDDRSLPTTLFVIPNRVLLDAYGTRQCQSLITKHLRARGETRRDEPAILRVPARERLFLMVMRAGEHAMAWAQPVDALEPGELRKLQVRIPKLARWVYGKVIDTTTRAPLAGARITVLTPRESGLDCEGPLSDREGRFQLSVLATDREASVHVAGYNELDFALPQQPMQPEHALLLRLNRSGVLELNVRHIDGTAAAQITIAATAEPDGSSEQHEALTWFARTDANGHCKLDLPAGETLSLTIHQQELLRWQSTIPKLAPAEHRQLSLELPAPLAVRGTLVNGKGQPIAHGKVWLGRASSSQRPDPSRWGHPPRPRQVVQSGALGEFSFVDLSPGFWYVGSGEQPIAGTTQVIQVIAGEPPAEILVTAYPELFISGRLDAGNTDASLEGSLIVAEAGGGRVESVSQPDGSFTLGPLWPAEFEVSARQRVFAAYAPSVRAQPGTSSLVLRLLPINTGGVIQGRLLDVDGEAPEHGYVQLDSATVSITFYPEQGTGHFGFGGIDAMPAGEYEVVAKSARGFASTHVSIAPNASSLQLQLQLQLQPAAIVELAGGGRMSIRDEHEVDACDASLLFEPQHICVLPRGHFTVVLQDDHGGITSHEINVTGAERYRFRLPSR